MSCVRGATAGNSGIFTPIWSLTMNHLLRRLAHEESGQDIIEYALVAAGIGVLLIPTIPTLGQALIGIYERITGEVNAIGNAGGGGS